MAFVNEKTEDGKWQTIDKEKKIILSKISGPDQEGQYDCELQIDGYTVKFSGVSGMKIHGTPKLGEPRQYEMNWHFFRLFIPEPIREKKQEIMDFITEALEAYGDNYKKEKAASVSVKFAAHI